MFFVCFVAWKKNGMLLWGNSYVILYTFGYVTGRITPLPINKWSSRLAQHEAPPVRSAPGLVQRASGFLCYSHRVFPFPSVDFIFTLSPRWHQSPKHLSFHGYRVHTRTLEATNRQQRPTSSLDFLYKTRESFSEDAISHWQEL